MSSSPSILGSLRSNVKLCGIAGFLSSSGFSPEFARSVGLNMGKAIAHRGPDDADVWFDVNNKILLSHRRLAVVDLSSAGHQPMTSKSGRYVVVFNGEIYNHVSIRHDLEKLFFGLAGGWSGHSDTETLLYGFDIWGIRETIERCVGMFAFAVWDKQECILTLGRDRLGEKPLYYGWQGIGEKACFFFGSELKALKAHPNFSAIINRSALCLMMRHNYIPAPYSIYQGISKLLPGSLLSVSLTCREPKLESYWSLPDITLARAHSAYQATEQEADDELETLLKSAIKQQMIADVPLGAFLSGGIDSSTIVSLMQSQSDRPVKTFTIGFNEKGYNEAVHAKAIAKHLGTDHTELYVTPEQAINVIPKLPTIYCEPFSDSSQIPTYLVSKLARQHVTVALSGDAGDELFAGYKRYSIVRNLWRKLDCMPQGWRDRFAKLIRAIPSNAWNSTFYPFRSLMPKSIHQMNFGDKMHKAANVLSSQSIDELYLGMVSHWDPSNLVLGATEPDTYLAGNMPNLFGLNQIERMMALDAMTYLPDDILVKVDRAAMGVSLETRVPFLDHRVVEFAWSLPIAYKINHGLTKWLLRKILYRYVPPKLIERPKQGFSVPIGHWMSGPLRGWAEALLSESKIKSDGYLDVASVRQKWHEHISGKRNWQYHLWNVLMFQAWLDEQL